MFEERRLMKRLLPCFVGLALIFGSVGPVDSLTIVLDFNDPLQAITGDIFGNTVSTFDVAAYGFAAGDFNVVTADILSEVENDYYGIPTVSANALSSIPDGKELDIDFEIGDSGTAPANGDTEFYYMQLGSGVFGPHIGSLGVAGLSVVRNSAGSGPNSGVTVGATVGSIFTDNINSMGGVGTALTSGNLSATRHAISGTTSHEIGHALSLLHLNKAGSVTHSGVPPLMGTGAIDLPNIDRISNREFAFSGFNDQEGGAAQFHVSQLVAAVGLRDVAVENTIPEPSAILLFSISILAAFGYGWRRRNHLTK